MVFLNNCGLGIDASKPQSQYPPGGFEFKSKVTTGGQMRKFEVPQYTQVGNAVPPLLARSLGEFIKKQLRNIDLCL